MVGPISACSAMTTLNSWWTLFWLLPSAELASACGSTSRKAHGGRPGNVMTRATASSGATVRAAA
jgi:hypothetical protein